jgi:hypothetical protein
MKIGYCRVSTDDQNPDLQLSALKRAGCRKIFTDKATGAHVKRPELAKCLKALKAGDVLIVWNLDRLGRSLHDLIGLLDDLKTRGMAFRSVTESIDTATPTGRAMWQMVGILAELVKIADTGTDKGEQGCGASTGREDGTQALADHATGRSCAQAGRAGGKPSRCRAIAQSVTADAV